MEKCAAISGKSKGKKVWYKGYIIQKRFFHTHLKRKGIGVKENRAGGGGAVGGGARGVGGHIQHM